MQSVRVDFDEPTNPCVNFYIKKLKKAAAAATTETSFGKYINKTNKAQERKPAQLRSLGLASMLARWHVLTN